MLIKICMLGCFFTAFPSANARSYYGMSKPISAFLLRQAAFHYEAPSLVVTVVYLVSILIEKED